MTGFEVALASFFIVGGGIPATVQAIQTEKQADAMEAQARAEAADVAEGASMEYRRALSLTGTQRAIAGAGGVDISGSPLIITQETLGLAAQESLQAVQRAQQNVKAVENAADQMRFGSLLNLGLAPVQGMIQVGGMVGSQMAANAMATRINQGATAPTTRIK